MSCPYCDESIPQAAKFCPKCGLPLGEDATLMGASLEGPNRWALLAGGAAVAAIALSIGFFSSRSATPGTSTRSQVVRREPVGRYAAPPRPAAGAGLLASPATVPVAAASPARTSGPAFTYSPQVKWAYTPPARPRPKPKPAPPPEAPRHLLTGLPRPQRVSVTVVRPIEPPLPAAPPMPGPSWTPPSPIAWGRVPGDAFQGPAPAASVTATASEPSSGSPAGAAGGPTRLAAGNPATGAPDPENWVYDPVHERYVFRGDRLPDPQNRYYGNNRVDYRARLR